MNHIFPCLTAAPFPPRALAIFSAPPAPGKAEAAVSIPPRGPIIGPAIAQYSMLRAARRTEHTVFYLPRYFRMHAARISVPRSICSLLGIE